MSEDLMETEIDRRDHRCRPPMEPRPRLGRRWRCDCDRTFQFVDTRVGRQWLPTRIADLAATVTRTR